MNIAYVYCTGCIGNIQVKYTKQKQQMENTTNTTFEVISIDAVGPLGVYKAFCDILTTQSELTKFLKLMTFVENMLKQ